MPQALGSLAQRLSGLRARPGAALWGLARPGSPAQLSGALPNSSGSRQGPCCLTSCTLCLAGSRVRTGYPGCMPASASCFPPPVAAGTLVDPYRRLPPPCPGVSARLSKDCDAITHPCCAYTSFAGTGPRACHRPGLSLCDTPANDSGPGLPTCPSFALWAFQGAQELEI